MVSLQTSTLLCALLAQTLQLKYKTHYTGAGGRKQTGCLLSRSLLCFLFHFFLFRIFPKVTDAKEKINSVLLENILTELLKKTNKKKSADVLLLKKTVSKRIRPLIITAAAANELRVQILCCEMILCAAFIKTLFCCSVFPVYTRKRLKAVLKEADLL